ncbi:MAG TPA: carboxypeptidase-like regulatory domain-containing protein [Candidatus Acidoferrales bacterium]|nr:carboxypeptidase-like regulatory domain-containing protein [Candidatus Acidoferrales bacterium]
MKCHLPFWTEWGFLGDDVFKITLYFLAGLLARLSLARAASGSPQKATPNAVQTGTSAIAGKVNGIAGEGQANNLAGVVVKLVLKLDDAGAGPALQSALTGESGRIQFTQLVAGSYALEGNAEGFKPWVKTVELQPGQAAVEEASLEINGVVEQIEVHGGDIEISTHRAENTAVKFGEISALRSAILTAKLGISS